MTGLTQSELYVDQAVQGVWDANFERMYPTDAYAELGLSLVHRDETEGALQAAVELESVRKTLQPLETCRDIDGQKGPDIHTIEHSVDVGFLAAAACIKAGLSEFAVIAAQTGLSHDAGKKEEAAQRLIHLPRRLTTGEKQIGVKPHAENGAGLAEKAGAPPIVCNGIRCHHGFGKEPYGGNPQEIFGTFNISDTNITPELFVAAIVAVVDVYHAARSVRPESGSKPRAFAMDLVGNLLVPKIVISNFDAMFTSRRHVAA